MEKSSLSRKLDWKNEKTNKEKIGSGFNRSTSRGTKSRFNNKKSKRE